MYLSMKMDRIPGNKFLKFSCSSHDVYDDFCIPVFRDMVIRDLEFHLHLPSSGFPYRTLYRYNSCLIMRSDSFHYYIMESL